MENNVSTVEIPAVEQQSEDPLPAAEEPPSADASAARALPMAYPDCRNDCVVFAKLAALGKTDCAYASIGKHAATGKAAVKKLLMHVDGKEFGVILETGADAPCIGDDKRRMIDHQINAADHDRRSKELHRRESARQAEEFRALSARRTHVEIAPAEDAAIEDLAPPSAVATAMSFVAAGVGGLFKKRWF